MHRLARPICSPVWPRRPTCVSIDSGNPGMEKFHLQASRSPQLRASTLPPNRLVNTFTILVLGPVETRSRSLPRSGQWSSVFITTVGQPSSSSALHTCSNRFSALEMRARSFASVPTAQAWISAFPRLPDTRFSTSNARITTWLESASSTKSCRCSGVNELSMGIRSDAEAGRKVNFKNASIYWLSFLIAVAMGTGNSSGDYSKVKMRAAAFRLSRGQQLVYRKQRISPQRTQRTQRGQRFLQSVMDSAMICVINKRHSLDCCFLCFLCFLCGEIRLG